MDKLNASQQKIVEYIIENNRITNRQIQELLGIKDSRALKIMKELIELGVVERQGISPPASPCGCTAAICRW